MIDKKTWQEVDVHKEIIGGRSILEDKEIIRHLEIIVESAKMLVRAGDPAVDIAAKRLLVTAHSALSYKCPEKLAERLIEFE
jgi:hypothetical protein